MLSDFTLKRIQSALAHGKMVPLALEHYPSRGQTAIQRLYQTKIGKLFWKRVSERNHRECQIPVKSGSLAEREWWAYRVAKALGLENPPLVLLGRMTTVQLWLDLPDAHHFITDQGPLALDLDNVFECACFDWLTGQIDRHDANYLYDFVQRRIILIDSAHGFLRYDGSLPHYLQLFEIACRTALHKKPKSDMVQRIAQLQQRLPELVPLRDGGEQEALQRRLQQMRTVATLQDVFALYRKSQ
ncbi:MAG: hypothetical protein HYV02_01010 [Deltaproteobacteria bacterium]|nr:hypothetical protein [Deltaproteobacteria bacterium]